VLRLEGIDHVTVTSADPERSVRFYRDVLGLAPDVEWPGDLSMLRCGATRVAIGHWARGAAAVSQPAITVHHFAFRVDAASYAGARAHLERANVPIDGEEDHGNCRSLYFRDPDGHQLELVCYELTGAPDRMPRPMGTGRDP
jgi:catechol 2,3-dioxygenase-like lactoylglutathione lyase family enzyme